MKSCRFRGWCWRDSSHATGTIWITCDKERLPGSSLCRKHTRGALTEEKREIRSLQRSIAGCKRRISKLRKVLK